MAEDRRKLFTLIATILGSTIVFLDGTIVNVALPAISDDLDAGLAYQQWVVEAYMLATIHAQTAIRPRCRNILQLLC